MTNASVRWLAHMLEAAPYMTEKDIERMRTYRPRYSLMFVAVMAAMLEV